MLNSENLELWTINYNSDNHKLQMMLCIYVGVNETISAFLMIKTNDFQAEEKRELLVPPCSLDFCRCSKLYTMVCCCKHKYHAI